MQNFPIDKPDYTVYYDFMCWRLDSRLALSPRPHTGAVGTHWWFSRRGVTVGYARTVRDPRIGAFMLLMEIEIREGFRGQGLSSIFIEHIEGETGTLRADSLQTSLGQQRIHVEVEPGGVVERVGAQSFVVDWEKRITRIR